ncbi:Mbeg1-like protein [Helcococcus kunzii]|uniref:Mbeg1-like protein n=1 Tax=Helcococcus kunzii TaxID=40091 RepID=UPI0024ACE862|nr:Mbeg1-like protein [Helcococcus kunzii]
MKDIFNYIKEKGNISFSELPFNEIDCAILSQISYHDLFRYYDKLPFFLRDIPKDDYKSIVRGVWEENKNVDLLKLISKYPRFTNIDVVDMTSKNDKDKFDQFFAMTLRLDDGSIVVVFRGTDFSIHGWAESLAMSFEPEIPGQISARNYLRKIGKYFQRNIIVCGHSKGANLAVFAASTVPKYIQDKITVVYDLDGPGFFDDFFERDDYHSMKDKIRKYIPEQSIFGMMLKSVVTPTIVDSAGWHFHQHFLLNWRTDDVTFKYDKVLDELSTRANNALTKWMEKFDVIERRKIVECLIDIMDDLDISNVLDLGKINQLIRIKDYYEQNIEEYDILQDALTEFIDLYKTELLNAIPSIPFINDKK